MVFINSEPDMEREMHANGKPFAISGEKKQIFLESLREGNFISTACRAAGIDKNTLLDWLCKGGDERYTRAIRHEDAPEPYRTFVEEVLEAEAAAEVHAVKQVKQAGDRDWRAASWMLERRHGRRWGARDTRMGIQSADGKVLGGAQVVVFIPDNGRGDVDPLELDEDEDIIPQLQEKAGTPLVKDEDVDITEADFYEVE
jgi:hypothetical protein